MLERHSYVASSLSEATTISVKDTHVKHAWPEEVKKKLFNASVPSENYLGEKHAPTSFEESYLATKSL